MHNLFSAPIFASRELHGSWKIIERELMIFTPNNINHQKKIAGFDLGKWYQSIQVVQTRALSDGTLIKTKSGAVFPKDANDWQLWNSTIVKKLSTAHEQGFKICIFSNQKGLLKVLQNDKKAFKRRIIKCNFQTFQGKRNVGTGDFQGKIRRICTALSIPIQVFISLGTYNYRKPFSGS
jgi:bifunctional polynucleotide phosphatase/kinase